MNRGSAIVAIELLGSEPRFNEAPIHESGKSAGCRGRPARRPGFNEAPIHESGKFARMRVSVWSVDASMRPRFMNRGSAAKRYEVVNVTLLQ